MHIITKEQIRTLALVINKAIHPHTDFNSVYGVLKMLEELPLAEKEEEEQGK